MGTLFSRERGTPVKGAWLLELELLMEELELFESSGSLVSSSSSGKEALLDSSGNLNVNSLLSSVDGRSVLFSFSTITVRPLLSTYIKGVGSGKSNSCVGKLLSSAATILFNLEALVLVKEALEELLELEWLERVLLLGRPCVVSVVNPTLL